MSMTNRSAHWALAAVFSTNLGVGLIFGFEPPLIAIVLNRAGCDALVIGTVIAISLVAVTLAGPMYPYLIGRLGLKRSVLGGITVGVAILVAMPYWNTIPAWIVLRILTGGALGLSWVASEIWMNTVSGAASRGTVMGIYGTVFSTGTVAGPVLLEITGTRGPEPFLIGALCLALTLLPLIFLRQAAESSAARITPPPQPLRVVLSCVPAAPVVMLAAAVAGLVESADLSLLPLFGLRAGMSERSALLLVTVFLAGNMVLQLPIGVLADRYGRRRLLGICALASGIGPLLLPRALESPALLWPLLFVWGGTLYAFYSQGIALLGEEFGNDSLASANTLFVMIYCIGGVLGPCIGGIALDVWPRMGLPLLLSFAALGLLAALVHSR
jgi:MFS family permease